MKSVEIAVRNECEMSKGERLEATWTDEEIEQALISAIGMIAVLLVSILFLGRLFAQALPGNTSQDQGDQGLQTSNGRYQQQSDGTNNLESNNQVSTGSHRFEKAEGLSPFFEIDDPEYITIGENMLNMLNALNGQRMNISKGSLLVVTIRPSDCNNVMIAKVLRAFSCVVSVICILHIPTDMPDLFNNSTECHIHNEHVQLKQMISKLRDAGISENHIADHRFLVCQSIIGRVAIIRQLGNTRVVSLVLDFNHGVYKQLSRFGFNVVIYGDEKTPSLDKFLSLIE